MAKEIELKILRSTSANLVGVTLAEGELVYDTTVAGLKIGDGSTPGESLPYVAYPVLDEDDMASESDTNTASQQSIKAYSDSATQTMTNKTLTSPVINTPTISGGSQSSPTITTPTITSPVLNSGVSGTAVLDEDDMASNSAAHLSTQQAIKAYMDNMLTVGAGPKNASIGWRSNTGPSFTGSGHITGGVFVGLGQFYFTHDYGHASLGMLAASASDRMYVVVTSITTTRINCETRLVSGGSLGNPQSCSITIVDLS